MSNEYNPDDWVIVKITPTDSSYKPYYRVLCSWSGSYAYGACWKLSSGVEDVTESEDGKYWNLPQSSGSLYVLRKGCERMSGIMAGVFQRLSQTSADLKLEKVKFEDFLNDFRQQTV